MHFKNNTYIFAFEFQIQSLMKPNMKNYSKHLSVTFLFFLSCVLCPASVSGDDKKDETPVVPIVVTNNTQNLHRGLVSEIDAYYSNGYVNVFFYGVSGSVAVTVYNISNGGQVRNLFDASSMNVSIDIRSILTSGEYIVEFELDNFDTYIGEFSI